MNHDGASSNQLICTVVVNDNFITANFIPNLDTERIRTVRARSITSPQHEIIRLAIRRHRTIDGAARASLV